MIASIGNRAFAYDDGGYGEPLVLLHGFPHDRTLWSQQRIALASRARCITPDLAGFGESALHEHVTIDAYADDVMRLLDHLGVERAIIGGLSMGGYVALACWRRHAARVSGLILSDTKSTGDTDEAKRKRDEMIALVERDGVQALAAAQITGMVGKRTRESNPALVDLVRTMMERQPADAVIAALRALRDRPDATPDLTTITVPTLILVGDEDVITPPTDARAMFAALPSAAEAQLDIIAGAGHASCVERPAAVTHAIADFLAARAERAQ